ncbi:MAG: thioredoxin family protein [Synergistaceae bacterium]
MIEIIDFYTNRCQPCREMAPILDKIASEQEGVELTKIDCEANKANLDMAVANGVRSVPVLIISNDKGDSQRLDGLQTEEQILQAIEALR